MADELFESALGVLRERFYDLDWKAKSLEVDGRRELVYQWPGREDEDVLICTHQSVRTQEPFHHHEFFYFNYTYQGSYDSISDRFGTRVTIEEGQLYAGQPFAGHALCARDDAGTTIIGVLIRREALFRTYLPMVLGNKDFFSFLVGPEANDFSEEYIRLSFTADNYIARILKMMTIEYAFARDDTPQMLRSLTHAFLMQVSRQMAASKATEEGDELTSEIVAYISENIASVSLKSVSNRFSYHPNYISSLLSKHLGKSFSQVLQEMRMERASMMLKGTPLSVEEVAEALGYASKSSFYKAFKNYYDITPRELSASA